MLRLTVILFVSCPRRSRYCIPLTEGTQPAMSICYNHVNPIDITDEWTRIVRSCKVRHNTDASRRWSGSMVFEHPCRTSTAV
jgi:hypothetical protein